MKTIFYTLTLFLISLNPISAQWEIIHDGSVLKSWLETIDFVNENVGWIAGGHGTLLKTSDGGENWNSLIINESWNINQIDFINESDGWAIGGAYIDPNWISYIWKTSDGGNTWVQRFSSTVFGFNSVYVIDVNNVYAVGGNKVYKTTNGGTNWVNVSPNQLERNYNSLWFLDSQTGIVVGNYNDGIRDRGLILKTTNGGSTWNQTIANEFNNIYDLQFLDSNNGYFRAHNDSTNFICRFDDFLETWTIRLTRSFPVRSYQYITEELAYAIMEDSTSYNLFMKSTDGGMNWQNTSNFNIYTYKIFFTSQVTGLALGSAVGPAMLRTTDQGSKWIINNISYPIIDVYFFDYQRGLVLGGACVGRGHCTPEGDLFKVNYDGTWTPAMEFNYYTIGRNFAFRGNSLGFAMGSWWDVTEIYKTTDEGNTWICAYLNYWENHDSLGYYFNGNSMCLTSAETVYVAGHYIDSLISGPGILSTTNSGLSWNIVWKDSVGEGLNSIFSIPNVIWSVGEYGTIIKYTPQTGWVKQTPLTDLPLNKVFFSNDYHGWIVGGYQYENDFQKILIESIDGGANWITIPNVTYLFRDIAFIDDNLGWAIGYTQNGEGGLLRTNDGGYSWVVVYGSLPAKLNALHIKDNYGWAVGDAGLILRTTDAGAVWVEEDQTHFPKEFVLEQNYPNPFNPSTRIKYQVSSISRVVLKVFDVLGREVATLVNEEQPVGAYEVEFNLTPDVRDLASGIYLYRLTAGIYSSTKKMIFLK